MKDIPSYKTIAMDEEGYFLSGGVRLADPDFGLPATQNIRRETNGSFTTTVDDKKIWIESFDEPLVAEMVFLKNGVWSFRAPYGFTAEFTLNSLSCDEWDRFHGRTVEHNLPFVFSRPAQAEFFRSIDEYDDDGITLNGTYMKLRSWLSPASEPGRSDFWSSIYRETPAPPWDLGTVHPAFPQMVQQMKLQKSRVLVLGAGRGHDAAFFAELGHVVTAVDFSEDAVEQMRSLYKSKSPGTSSKNLENLTIHHGDALSLDHTWDKSFDVIVEHTCYCAIPPTRRNDLVKAWRRTLTPGGYVLAVFFAMDRPEGPPYGGTEWEIRERLKKGFQFLNWARWRFSPPARTGTELAVIAQAR